MKKLLIIAALLVTSNSAQAACIAPEEVLLGAYAELAILLLHAGRADRGTEIVAQINPRSKNNTMYAEQIAKFAIKYYGRTQASSNMDRKVVQESFKHLILSVYC